MKRFTINWAIPGLLAMIVVIAAVAWMQAQASISPDPAKLATQCSGCHTMDTHVALWQESSHKDVSCTACHTDPGVRGWVEMQLGLLRMKNRVHEVDIAKVVAEVPNQRCLDCHARQMPWVMQDLKPAQLDEKGEPIRPAIDKLEFLPAVAGHDVHLVMDNPLKCVDCHQAVSHGPAATAREDQIEKWHGICLDCHAQEKVALEVRNTVSCSACHLDMNKMLPDDHKSTAFRQTHGKSAGENTASCEKCHLNPGVVAQAGTGAHGLVLVSNQTPSQSKVMPTLPPGTIKASGEVKDVCATCHGISMPHPQTFLKEHANGFNSNPGLCASCHGTREQGFNLTFKGDPRTLSTTDPSCTSCHAQPMPHPDSWSDDHSAAAKAAPATCDQCHSPQNPVDPNSAHASQKFCQDCHMSKFAHGSNYVGKHKGILAAYGNNQNAAGCTQCHTPTQNSCTSCHTSGVNSTQQWHAKDFVATHDDKLASLGGNLAKGGCTDCHTTTKISGVAQNLSCTTCHSAGLGQKTQWHPSSYWITHARTTTQQNKDACYKCHSYVEPSCSKCHTRY